MTRSAFLFAIGLPIFGQFTTKLSPETLHEFEAYQSFADRELSSQSGLWIDQHPDATAKAKRGEIVTYSLTGDTAREVTEGLIHDWIGDMYIRGATVAKVRDLLLDTQRHASIYPEIQRASVLSQQGNSKITELSLKKKKVLTIRLDIVYRNEWREPSPETWIMTARSQSVREWLNGKLLPPDEGDGYLWRMNSQWTLRQDGGGVWVELRSVSLSRDTPAGLGWIIRPLIRNFPVESITSTLEATRRAL